MTRDPLKLFLQMFAPGEWPLHEAVMSGECTRVRNLINAGHYLDEPLPLGDTPLHLAAHSGLPGQATLLLEAGADVNSRTRERYTPLHFAINSWFRDYAPFDGGTVPDRVECVALLLRHGADVDSLDKRGWGPLHLAAMSPSAAPPSVRMLLEAGANPNLADKSGVTPLQVCCRLVLDVETVETLLAFGAQPEPKLAELLDSQVEHKRDESESRRLVADIKALLYP